jgi:hypothetical protein
MCSRRRKILYADERTKNFSNLSTIQENLTSFDTNKDDYYLNFSNTSLSDIALEEGEGASQGSFCSN